MNGNLYILMTEHDASNFLEKSKKLAGLSAESIASFKLAMSFLGFSWVPIGWRSLEQVLTGEVRDLDFP